MNLQRSNQNNHKIGARIVLKAYRGGDSKAKFSFGKPPTVNSTDIELTDTVQCYVPWTCNGATDSMNTASS